MGKKIIVVGVIVLVIVVAVMAMNMRRSSMLSQASQVTGGLVAVSADGTPIPPPANVSATQLPENMAMQQAGDMTVLIALNPYPPTGYNPSDFEVTLTDANGQAISDATVNVNLTMPTMWMPPNQFPLTAASNGKYSAPGQFTMRGPWRIEVVITRGAKTQSVFFDVWL
jgi:hypothetical protein